MLIESKKAEKIEPTRRQLLRWWLLMSFSPAALVATYALYLTSPRAAIESLIFTMAAGIAAGLVVLHEAAAKRRIGFVMAASIIVILWVVIEAYLGRVLLRCATLRPDIM